MTRVLLVGYDPETVDFARLSPILRTSPFARARGSRSAKSFSDAMHAV